MHPTCNLDPLVASRFVQNLSVLCSLNRFWRCNSGVPFVFPAVLVATPQTTEECLMSMNLSKVMNVNHQRLQSSVWEVQARACVLGALHESSESCAGQTGPGVGPGSPETWKPVTGEAIAYRRLPVPRRWSNLLTTSLPPGSKIR